MYSSSSPSGEIEPGDQSSSDQTLTIAQPHSRQNLRRKSWWAITYPASLVVFPVMAVLTWTQCDFSAREISDWKPILALADAAWGKGDLHDAKHLYLKAGKFLVWRDDWAGLLAAACGIKQLEKKRGPYSPAHALLLRAMVAAEKRQSQSGLVGVAKAFAALGEDEAASMVLSLVGKDWVAETNDSTDVVSPGCWDK